MYLFFDVETRGLFGEAFAVGYVVTTDTGKELVSDIHCCPVSDASPDENENIDETTRFLEAHVLPTLPEPDCFTTRAVRDKFRMAWHMALSAARKADQVLYLASDVAYPCEVRFLSQCRKDGGPNSVYPLIDVASVLLANGMDPTGSYPRLENEQPSHNPLNDARQSARMFFSALRVISTLKQDIADAAHEINCRGSLAERVRVLKTHHGQQVERMEAQVKQLSEVCKEAHTLADNLHLYSKTALHEQAGKVYDLSNAAMYDLGIGGKGIGEEAKR